MPAKFFRDSSSSPCVFGKGASFMLCILGTVAVRVSSAGAFGSLNGSCRPEGVLGAMGSSGGVCPTSEPTQAASSVAIIIRAAVMGKSFPTRKITPLLYTPSIGTGGRGNVGSPTSYEPILYQISPYFECNSCDALQTVAGPTFHAEPAKALP